MRPTACHWSRSQKSQNAYYSGHFLMIIRRNDVGSYKSDNGFGALSPLGRQSRYPLTKKITRAFVVKRVMLTLIILFTKVTLLYIK